METLKFKPAKNAPAKTGRGFLSSKPPRPTAKGAATLFKKRGSKPRSACGGLVGRLAVGVAYDRIMAERRAKTGKTCVFRTRKGGAK